MGAVSTSSSSSKMMAALLGLLAICALPSSFAFTSRSASNIYHHHHQVPSVLSLSLSSSVTKNAKNTKTTLQMGLFSSSSSSSATGRISTKKTIFTKALASLMRKTIFQSKSNNNRQRLRLQRQINSINSVFSKIQTQNLWKTLHQWQQKRFHRMKTLAIAATFFCSTMLIKNDDVAISNTLASSSSSSTMNHNHMVSTAKIEPNLITTASVKRMTGVTNRGGEGISATQPSVAMKRQINNISIQTNTINTHRMKTTQPSLSLSSKTTTTTTTANKLFASTRTSSTTNMPMANVPIRLPQRGGSATANDADPTAFQETKKTFKMALQDLKTYMRGTKSDTLLLLLATSLITPVCKRLGTSPILGFLAAGMVLGPNALGLISGIHTTETLAELGIVFFLFEMGIELSFDRLLSMKKDVFGLGLSQFVLTATAIAAAGSLFGIPANALVVIGGGLALSSSAFVLQLLKDKNQLATRFGKAAFGVLLFQDLAVVPLLVVTPILAGGGQGLASALGSALVKAGMALTSIAFAGRVLLNPLFKTVAGANSQEAFLGVILLTVLSMSFMTEGLGLSNTLGAFLAGVLLSETKYRYQIEADIAPFRGILLGLFFVTVGFEIDLGLIASNLPLVATIVAGILFIKSAVLTLLSLAFGLSLSTSQQTGLILSQGGEFAFVAFGLARNLGILDPATTKLLLTSVALTMAVTPFLAEIGGKISKRLEEKSDFTHYLGQDRDANEIKESDDFVVVVGYGTVGRVVCDLLDRKLYRYVGLEINPNKAIKARNKGLPVFYGDIGRPEVAEAFNVGKAKAIIVTIADKNEANRAVISLRRTFPDMKIFARAKDADHAERLQRTLDVVAMVPVVPEDNILLTLPFGGAVLRSLGAAQEEVSAILEGSRKEILAGRGLADDEQNLVLAQLGISVEPKKVEQPSGDGDELEEASNANIELSSSDVALAAAEEKKDLTPMVAEVIEAATGKVTPPSIPVKIESKEAEVALKKDESEVKDIEIEAKNISIPEDKGTMPPVVKDSEEKEIDVKA